MKRLLTLTLACALMLSCFAVAAPVAAAETIPMTWKKFDKAYVVFEIDVSDDATDLATIDQFLNIVTKEYGFPLCLSTTTNSMSAAKVKKMHNVENHGGEITSHTHSGKALNTTMTWDKIEYEYKHSLEVLQSYGFNVNGIMLMGGGGSSQSNPALREDTSVEFRTESEKYVSKYYKYSDLYGVSEQYYNPRINIKATPKNYINEAIANKGWVSIYTHGLTDDGYPEGLLRNILDYLKEKEDAGELEVVTYKYLYENLANWQKPVDFGDTKYTVDFYSTDEKTLLSSTVVVAGKDVEAPLLDVAKGVKLNGWSQSLKAVNDNMTVYAECSYTDGRKVAKSDPSPLKAHTTHTWGNFTNDKSGHTGACTVCDEKLEKENHTFKNDVCSVCGYKKESSSGNGNEGDHTHKLTLVNGKAATCNQNGSKKHYQCSCGALFTDAKGKTEITDADSLIIKATGKHVDANKDFRCDDCNKKLSGDPNTTVKGNTTTTSAKPDVTEEPDVSEEPNASEEPNVSEPDASEPVDTDPIKKGNNALLYILVGAGALIVIAAAVVAILLLRKKKAAENTDAPAE